VGHRIASISGDSSLSDHTYNHCDFIYQTDNCYAFRMPFDDDSGDLLPSAGIENHKPLTWPRDRWWRFRRRLWWAQITDILVPANIEKRYPDRGVIALSSGWFVVQCSGGPMGIAPFVTLVKRPDRNEPLTSVWSMNNGQST
jgi:hypothetical protein